MMRSPFYLICLVVIVPVIRGQLPSFIKPCRLSSPDFIKCAVKNGNEAIPFVIEGVKEFDIPHFKPLIIPLVEFSSGDLKLNGTNVIITGVKDFVITDILFDKEKRLLGLDFKNPLLELNFEINIDGKIASLRIEGNGPAEIKLYNATYAYRMFYIPKEKQGKIHASFEKDEFVIKPSNVFIHLDNLFNGNKLLGDSMNKFLNENWKEVLTELQPVISEVVGSIARKMISRLFEKVPMEELFIGY